MLVVLHAGLNNQSRHKQINETIKKRIKRATCFLKGNIDMTIQSQAFTKHMLASLDMLQQEKQKSIINTLFCSKANKTPQVEQSQLLRKPVIF